MSITNNRTEMKAQSVIDPYHVTRLHTNDISVQFVQFSSFSSFCLVVQFVQFVLFSSVRSVQFVQFSSFSSFCLVRSVRSVHFMYFSVPFTCNRVTKVQISSNDDILPFRDMDHDVRGKVQSVSQVHS